MSHTLPPHRRGPHPEAGDDLDLVDDLTVAGPVAQLAQETLQRVAQSAGVTLASRSVDTAPVASLQAMHQAWAAFESTEPAPAPAPGSVEAEVPAALLLRPEVAAPVAAPPAVPAPATAATAAPAAAAEGSGAALRLLQFEAELRRQPDPLSLLMHLANESTALVPYDQGMVWRHHRASGRLRPVVLSGQLLVDRQVPLLRVLARVLHQLRRTGALASPLDLNLRDLPAACKLRQRELAVLDAFALPHLLWLPMKDTGGAVNAGLLVVRAQSFTPGAQLLLARVAETGAHACTALSRRRSLAHGTRWARLLALLCLGALAAGAMVPVRLSVMAPVEVVAAKPQVITAPISGVVKQILVAPSTTVAAGAPLLQFDDVQPRNEMVLAQQRLAVAQAKDARTAAAAFQDAVAAHDLATARAEFQLATVTYQYALEVLQRTLVRSPAAGVVIYTDRRDWEGRSVQVGEEILQVADPSQVAYRIDLSTGNAIGLADGAAIDLYLDNVPLGGLPARLRSVSYTPRTQPGGDTTYTVMADPDAGSAAPRIGARGTARLCGEEVPLIVQLLRRPLVAGRQLLGL